VTNSGSIALKNEKSPVKLGFLVVRQLAETRTGVRQPADMSATYFSKTTFLRYSLPRKLFNSFSLSGYPNN